jgi:hypothetical protein
MLPTTAKLIYENPLQTEQDVADFRMEGEAKTDFEGGRMKLANALDPSLGQQSNFVFWCPLTFPANLAVTWEFKPLQEPGLAMLFFSAAGINGEDLFAPSLAERKGVYSHYYDGDMNAYHASYFRRRYPAERVFHTCNLRKSKGLHLVCQGADPIPGVDDATEPYRILLMKQEGRIRFFINELLIFDWFDEGEAYGPILGPGKIGFRQMAPLVAEYAYLKVYDLGD